MNKIIDFLPNVKANRYTYYNLDKNTVNDYKKNYKYLLKHKNNSVLLLFKKDITLLKHCKKGSYIDKYNAMRILISHLVL
jgi:hypothetical protein